MNKIIDKKLTNGLRVIIASDSSKHYAYAEINTYFGGLTKGFIYNDQEYILPDGVAHMLEHALIDKSPYGNMFHYQEENHVDFNGTTSAQKTMFYIDTLLNYEETLRELITCVNTCSFGEEDIEEIKAPIFEEIKRKQDNRFKNVNDAVHNCLFNDIKLLNTVGSMESVSSISYDLLKLCHDVFYQPKNQVILLCGNIDVDESIKIIEDAYSKLNKEDVDYQLLEYDEKLAVNKRNATIIDNDNEEITTMEFKLDLTHLTPYEKVKLSFYIEHFLSYNFNDGSEIYKYMSENQYCIYSINRDFYKFDKFFYISLTCFTKEADIFAEQVLNIFKNLPYNESDFEIWKKTMIISLILRDESPSKRLFPYVDNVFSFGYEEEDHISDIEAYTGEDYLNLLKKLDFSNYVVVKRIHDSK